MLFGKCFSDEKPDKMLQGLFYSKSKSDNRDKLVMIQKNFDYTANRATQCHQVRIKVNLPKYWTLLIRFLILILKKSTRTRTKNFNTKPNA